MATKTTSKTSTQKDSQKTSTETEKLSPTTDQTNKVENTDVSKLMEMMAQMQSQLTTMSNELASTKSELASTKGELSKAKEIMETTEVKEGIIIGDVTAPNSNNFGQLVTSTGTAYPVQSVNLSQNSDYNYTNVPQPISATPSKADMFLEMMANRKADKEITIVHNREVLGGGTTHIELNGISIDFRSLGETRTLSWAQFEQLASKYNGFFKREVILVADKDREVAEEYQLPCVKRTDGATLTRADLNKMPTMSVEGLIKLYNSLSVNDKKFMLSYWLGQCYTRTPGFYERYKIETLNSLSKNGTFDALLAFMNGEALNAGRSNQSQTGGVVDGQIIPPGNQLNNLIDTHR